MYNKFLCTLTILALYLSALHCQMANSGAGTPTPVNTTSNFTNAPATNGTNVTTNTSTTPTPSTNNGSNGTIIVPNGSNATINGTNNTIIFVNGTNGTLGTNGTNATQNVTGTPGSIGNNNTLNATNGTNQFNNTGINGTNGTNGFINGTNGTGINATNVTGNPGTIGNNITMNATNGVNTGAGAVGVIGGPTNGNNTVVANGPSNNTNVTCNLTSSTCNSTGSVGVDLTITCVNITTCPNQITTQTCVTSYCNCANSTNILPGNNVTNNNLCQCLSCFSRVLFSNGTTNTTQNVTYSYANFTANTPAATVYASMLSAFNNVILQDISNYWNQPWADQRTASLFGVFPGDPNYQVISRDLVNDWGSVYSPFQCSSLFCNGKGYCTIGPINNTNNLTNNTQNSGPVVGVSQFPSNSTKTPVCTCISGWMGKRCVFPDQDYNYGLNWTNGIGSWLNSALANKSLNASDPATFQALANIAGLLPQFTSQVQNADVGTAQKVQTQLMTTLYNSSVNLTDPNIQATVSNLTNNLMTVNDTLLGVNPVDVLLRLGTLNGTNATKYLFYASQANLNGNTVLSLPTGSPMRQLRGLLQRMLQSLLSIFNLNTASPDATVPQTVSQSINNSVGGNSNISYAFAAIRDPKPMMNSVDNYINSQIVGERVYLNGNPENGFNYTNTASNIGTANNNSLILIDLPWAYTPFNLRSGATYLNNCQVFRWDGANFVPTNTCALMNTTDQYKAVINCQNFDIIGVGCTNQTTTVKVSTTSGGFTGNNANSNGYRIQLASFVAVLLMFVF